MTVPNITHEPQAGERISEKEGLSNEFLEPKVFSIDEKRQGVVYRSIESAFCYNTKHRVWKHWSFVKNDSRPDIELSELKDEQPTFGIFEDFQTLALAENPSHLIEPLHPFLKEVLSEANAAKYYSHIPEYCELGRSNRCKRYWDAGAYDCREIWRHTDFIRGRLLELQVQLQPKRPGRGEPSESCRARLKRTWEERDVSRFEDLVEKIVVLQGFVECLLDNEYFIGQYGDNKAQNNISPAEKLGKRIAGLYLFPKGLGTLLDFPEFLTVLEEHRRTSCSYDAFQTLKSQVGERAYQYFEDPKLCIQLKALNYHIKSIEVVCKCLHSKLKADSFSKLSPAHHRLFRLSGQSRRVRHDGAKAIHLITHGKLPTNLKATMSAVIFAYASHVTLKDPTINPESSHLYTERKAFISGLQQWKELLKLDTDEIQAYMDATYLLWGKNCDRATWLAEPETANDNAYVEQLVRRMHEHLGVSTERMFCTDNSNCGACCGNDDDDSGGGEIETMPVHFDRTPDSIFFPESDDGGTGLAQPVTHYLGQDYPYPIYVNAENEPNELFSRGAAADVSHAIKVIIMTGTLVLFAASFFKFVSDIIALDQFFNQLADIFASLPSYCIQLSNAFSRDVINPLVNEFRGIIDNDFLEDLLGLASWFSVPISGTIRDAYDMLLSVAETKFSSHTTLFDNFCEELRDLLWSFESSIYGISFCRGISAGTVTIPIIEIDNNDDDDDEEAIASPKIPMPPFPSPLPAEDITPLSTTPLATPPRILPPAPTPPPPTAAPKYTSTLTGKPNTGPKKYICPDCGESFDWSQNFRRHQRNFHHKSYSRPTSSGSPLSNLSALSQPTSPSYHGDCVISSSTLLTGDNSMIGSDTKERNLSEKEAKVQECTVDGKYICPIQLNNGKQCSASLDGRRIDNIRKHEKRVHGGIVSDWLQPRPIARTKRRRIE